MKLKGISYDAGCHMGVDWRPVFDPRIVRRELQIIHDDLHCNTVGINALDLGRLETAAELALEAGLGVWLFPRLWDKGQEETIAYLARAASRLERLREKHPESVVLVVGGEFTLFVRGILEGSNVVKRLGNPRNWERIKAGEHNKPLNEFLARAVPAARKAWHGRLSYASLIWEKVDWSLFDVVGVDHYRAQDVEANYVDMLKPLFETGKPVVVTEFGYNTYQSDGKLAKVVVGGGDVDFRSLFFHSLPLVGRFVRPKVRNVHPRDEGWQARKVAETLEILDHTGVEGAFVGQFESQINPYDEEPRYDLDTTNNAVVKSYEGGRHGTTYPDMPWEPKEAFGAVAKFYSEH